MHILNTQKTGFTVGLLLGGWHLLWSFLVLTGLGQPLINFVLWAHMIHLPYVVGPFDITAALTLIIFTSLMGFIIGWVFAYVWNWLHRV